MHVLTGTGVCGRYANFIVRGHRFYKSGFSGAVECSGDRKTATISIPSTAGWGADGNKIVGNDHGFSRQSKGQGGSFVGFGYSGSDSSI